MATLEEQIMTGISSLPPQQIALIDRWIDSDPEAVRVLVSAVPGLMPMFEPFISGDGTAQAGVTQNQGAMQRPEPEQRGADMLARLGMGA